MRRALKWIVPLVVFVEVVLVWSGAMELRDAVLVVAGLEALLFLIGLGGLALVVRRYRKERKAGLDPWRALEDGLSLVLPRTAARLIVKEPRLFACLLRWTFRRVRLAEGEFSYHRRSVLRGSGNAAAGGFGPDGIACRTRARPGLLSLGLVEVGSASSWRIRYFWLLGLYASLVALPHRLEETGLRLRHGILAEGFVPYKEIDEVVQTARKAPVSEERFVACVRGRRTLLGYGQQDRPYTASEDSAFRDGLSQGERPGLPLAPDSRRPGTVVRQYASASRRKTPSSEPEAERSPVVNKD